MVKFFRRKTTRRRPPLRKKKWTRGKPLRKALPKRINRSVKMVVRRLAETKSVQLFSTPVNIPSVASAAFVSGASILPLGLQPGSMVLQQGVGQGQRIGNKVSIVRSTFKGTVFPSQFDMTYNTTPKPLEIKLWIFYDKSDPHAVPAPELLDDFFQNGNSYSGFNNGLPDLWRPVNTDKYRILATRRFKIGYSNYYGTGVNLDANGFTNNDFKLNQNFNIPLGKLIPKSATFNDNNTVPSQRQCYAMFCPCYADGSAIGGTQLPAQVSWMQEVRYKDS